MDEQVAEEVLDHNTLPFFLRVLLRLAARDTSSFTVACFGLENYSEGVLGRDGTVMVARGSGRHGILKSGGVR